MAHVTTHTKLIVRVLQDVLARESFSDYADLTEALKCRCAKLKIFYNSELVLEAIEQLERGGKTPLISMNTATPVERPPTPEIISRNEAGQIYQALVARYEREHPQAPPVRPSSQPKDFPDLVEVASWR